MTLGSEEPAIAARGKTLANYTLVLPASSKGWMAVRAKLSKMKLEKIWRDLWMVRFGH
jgi:hypothetical protein